VVGSQEVQKAWKCLIVNDTLQEGEILGFSGIWNVNMLQQCGKLILNIYFNEIGKEFLSSRLKISMKIFFLRGNMTNYMYCVKS